MTHLLPPHGVDINIAQHSSISQALDLNQHQPSAQQQDFQPLQQPSPASATVSRKRKKISGEGEDGASSSEPRRLRRSHEACARCRNKKIKCDSKHPKCTACATAGVVCNQEDRHRQTLTPRGHTEKIERQILQCSALLKRFVHNFDLEDLDSILAREGVDVDASPMTLANAFHFAPAGSPTRSEQSPSSAGPKGYPYPPPPPHMMHPGFHPIPVGYPPPPPPNGAHYPMPMPMGMYPPGMAPYQLPQHMHPHSPGQDIKGQDPQSNDMSSAQALAKNFGVSAAIVNDLKLGAVSHAEAEDLAVGSGGLSSGRDRELTESLPPRNSAHWITVHMRRSNSIYTPNATSTVPIWLPKDRNMVKHIIRVYFQRLNYHRPVFNMLEFEQTIAALYDGHQVHHDPGYVCSLYLVLALGTMSELNKNAGNIKDDSSQSPTQIKNLLPSDWPEHEEFVARALAVKPDLRVTVSSLQALILLHWYLYTERQGRSLWRLVGSLVRLAIELGLHHDPTQQGRTFTEEESQLRIRLWATVMMHDRGTSILLGRPLAIAPTDSNTARPSHARNEFSEHFYNSAPIADIQADIVNSLYSPVRQTADMIVRSATRIIKSMVEFRRGLPEEYKYFFSGTEDWPAERKSQLLEQITDDQGLTLLKLGISRILLLRALFSSKELPYSQRHKALNDAIVTSHNVIVIHYQLIKYPDIAFFVSPIPLHIAAMVILYGHMSRCERLSRQTAIEDIWMALDMLPRFRWRWERKDMNGGHPLIAKLAEKVFEINLHQVNGTGPTMLLPELDWGDIGSPIQALSPQQATPTQTQGPYSNGAYPVPHKNGQGDVNGHNLVDVPAGLFWPIDPQNPVGFSSEHLHMGQAPTHQHYQAIGAIGCQPSQEMFMLEEKDPTMTNAHMQRLINAIDQDEFHAFKNHHINQPPHAQGSMPMHTG